MQLLTKLLRRNFESSWQTKPRQMKIGKSQKNAIINQIISMKL